MKILIDENIPRPTVEEMTRLGHKVIDIRGTVLEGLDDDELWSLAQREQALLITTDKEFLLRRNEPHYGVIMVRLRKPTRDKIHVRVLRALRRYRPEQWPGLVVVMRDTVWNEWRVS